MEAKTIERIMLFAEVSACGSFTAAADKLAVSKSYLSQAVSALEKELDIQLMLRTTRTLRLTAAGEALLQQMPKLHDFWYQTQSKIQATQESASGMLRVTAPIYMAEYLLWPLFQRFLALNPDVQLELDTGNTLVDQVQLGFDLAIRITNTPPEHLIARELIRLQYTCCATPEYLAKNGTPEVPDDLKQHNCLSLIDWKRWRFYDSRKTYHVDTQGSVQTNQNNILKQSALAHLGIVRLPHYIVQNELADGRFLHILPNYQQEQLPVYLLYPPLKKRPQKTQNCIDFLLSAFNAES